MKKVRIFIIFIFLLIITGCTATYEININDNTVTEKLKLIETDQSIFDVRNDSGWTIREMFESVLVKDEFSHKNYSVKSLSNNSRLGVEYKSKEMDSVLNSTVLNQCYINPSVEVKDGVVYIDTGNNFKCYEYYNNLDTVKIVLKTNHKVVSTNASSKNGNSYIWNFTKDSDKQIKITYYQDKVSKKFDYVTLIVISGIFVVIGSVTYILLKKRKNNNQI